MFKVKAAGGATQPMNERLLRHVSSFVNMQANFTKFEVHDAMELALAARTNGWQPHKATTGAKHYFCSAAFAKEVLGASIGDGQAAYSLCVPKYRLDDDDGDVTPRSFYHHGQLLTVQPLQDMIKPGGVAAPMVTTKFGDKPRYPPPRCGKTGHFYSREDAVDNLIQAGIALQFGSSFWIPHDHPKLGKFLQLKDGAAPIAIPLFNRVAPIDVVKLVPNQLVVNELKSARNVAGMQVSPYQNANVPAGTNIFTGKASENAYLSGAKKQSSSSSSSKASKQQVPLTRNLPTSSDFMEHPLLKARGVPVNNRGIWISLSQFVRHGLALKDELKPEDSNGTSEDPDADLLHYISHLLDVFVPIEERQLVVYNGDQLAVPGRLALKSSAAHSKDALFK